MVDFRLAGGNMESQSDHRRGKGLALPLPIATFVGDGTISPRYEDLGPIGTGAMGEVRRVRDLGLNRVMAMKVMRPDLTLGPGIVERFVEEAQATAQIGHSGIVPVHELGRLADGRYYFTMDEVRGRTFTEIISEVHGASPGRTWERSASGWTFRRLIDAFHKVCEAVAAAHRRGIVHRDLKPANLMVGAYGEVLVMDWGLAKVVGSADAEFEVHTVRSSDDSLATLMGTVAGTPVYMAPEQARGAVDTIVPATDVYALGAFLYEILSGRPPYEGRDSREVLRKVLAGPPPPPGRGTTTSAGSTFLFAGGDAESEEVLGPPVPHDLVSMCMTAMEREIDLRYVDAAALAAEVGAWLDGELSREQAREAVRTANALIPAVAALRERAGVLRAEAAEVLRAIGPREPEEAKREAWTSEDEADRLEVEARVKEVEVLQLLRAALAADPQLDEAHERLADHYRGRHAAAEHLGDELLAAEFEALLRNHDTGKYSSYLDGRGTVTIETDPPGAQVTLLRYVRRGRRLIAEEPKSLGRTPIRAARVAMGRWLCMIRAPGRAEVRYPVSIGRNEAWDGAAPGSRKAVPIRLPLQADLSTNEVYVPAGWFRFGGDPEAMHAVPARRVWIDAFVIRKFPITNAEFIDFLDDLVASGREADALRWAPRERAGSAGDLGALVYGRDADGRFFLRPDADGDIWDPDWPVFLVDWGGAVGFAAWLAEKSGLPWRLVDEVSWEKAARGVDGRRFPWGDHLDPTWACMRDSHEGAPMPQVVDTFPVDESPYGVRGMGGNVRDWCADPFERDGPVADGARWVPRDVRAEDAALNDYRVARGGHWYGDAAECRSAFRYHDRALKRDTLLGVRVMRFF